MSERKDTLTAPESELTREAWKVFRIMAEFVDGYEKLAMIRPSVSVFGSARTPQGHPHYALGEAVGRLLSDAGFSVVTGGGPGLMEAVNKGAFAGPSSSIGLNITLPHGQEANAYQDVSLTFKHYFTRKVMFVKYASAYVVLPGGFGTLDELAEILTLVQTGKSRRIPIVLLGRDHWDGLLAWFGARMVDEGMISESDMALVHPVDTPEEVLEVIRSFYAGRDPGPSPAECEVMREL